MGMRGEARVTFLERKVTKRTSNKIIWRCSHIVILYREDFYLSITAIVLQVILELLASNFDLSVSWARQICAIGSLV